MDTEAYTATRAQIEQIEDYVHRGDSDEVGCAVTAPGWCSDMYWVVQ
jgi:hypothetical protein